MSDPVATGLRVGLVGGGFGRTFSFHEHPACRVVAVADMLPARRQALAELCRCATAYSTLDEMLQDSAVDAVALFTPPPDHARHSIAALRSGKHVLCAVPAAMTLEECAELVAAVESSGLVYMMAETSYYRRETIRARDWFREGRFGTLFYTEAEYWHEGLEGWMRDDGKPNWRHGLPPMAYPTHSSAFVTGVTGERLTEVSCIGWGDENPVLASNAYDNPFWNEVAFFRTDRGNCARLTVGWHVGHPVVERATWYGSAFSFAMPARDGEPGWTCEGTAVTPLEVPESYEGLPAELRHPSGHGGSHTHLTHEFVSAVIAQRRPAIDVYDAVAYTAPGIVAHRSALRNGEQMRIPDFGHAQE